MAEAALGAGPPKRARSIYDKEVQALSGRRCSSHVLSAFGYYLYSNMQANLASARTSRRGSTILARESGFGIGESLDLIQPRRQVTPARCSSAFSIRWLSRSSGSCSPP